MSNSVAMANFIGGTAAAKRREKIQAYSGQSVGEIKQQPLSAKIWDSVTT